MKKIICVLLLALCLAAPAAHAAFDPPALARSSLTEVFGYTEEDAAAFCFEEDGPQRLLFYPVGHPEWT